MLLENMDDSDRSPGSMAAAALPNGTRGDNHEQANEEPLSVEAFSTHQALQSIVQNVEFLVHEKRLWQILTTIKAAPQLELELQHCRDEQEQLKALVQRNLVMYNEDRDRWKVENSELQNQIDSLQDTVRQKEEAIKGLEEDTMKKSQASSSKLEQAVKTHKLETTELQKKITDLQTKLAEQGQKFGALNIQLKEKKSDITQLNLKLKSQGQTLFDVQKTSGALQKELDDAAKLKVELRSDDDMVDV